MMAETVKGTRADTISEYGHPTPLSSMLGLSARLLKCRATYSRVQVHRLFHNVRAYKEDKRWPGWQVIIGIEAHAQIKSRRKLFSGMCCVFYFRCPTDTNFVTESLTSDVGELHNIHVSPFDAAFPGTLPVSIKDLCKRSTTHLSKQKLNQKCVDLALRTALALRCDIQPRSSFDRKHYFYPDLPAGYQITQQYGAFYFLFSSCKTHAISRSAPIALKGELDLTLQNTHPFRVRIKQIQLEQVCQLINPSRSINSILVQDTAKSTFVPRTRTSHIDLNRAGTGLMEIVSEPDLRSVLHPYIVSITEPYNVVLRKRLVLMCALCKLFCELLVPAMGTWNRSL